MSKEHHIFISYSRANTDKKDQIVADLREVGFDVWVDSSEIPATTRWLEQIQKGIRGSQILVYLGSEDALKSHYIAYELGYADALELPIYPALVKGMRLDVGIPDWLLTRQSIELRGHGQYQTNKSKFIKELCNILVRELQGDIDNTQELNVGLSVMRLLNHFTKTRWFWSSDYENSKQYFFADLDTTNGTMNGFTDDDLFEIVQIFLKWNLLTHYYYDGDTEPTEDHHPQHPTENYELTPLGKTICEVL